VTLPKGVRVVGVGGSTLGGSYKTPFVLALARSLAERGRSVAVVTHGYGASVREARHVLPADDVREVGDDALFLARELHELDVPVIVGGPWSASISLAAAYGRLLITDGLLQASPRRLGWSALVVDGHRPWMSNRCPPAGDLRASPAALRAASDDTVEVVDRSSPVVQAGDRAELVQPHGSVFRVPSDIVALRGSRSESLPLDAVAHRRVGLLAAVARPERLVAALEARGIVPNQIRFFGDHRPLPERRWNARRLPPVDLWLTTGKCATKLGSHYESKPVWTLVHGLELPWELIDRAAGD
jgi:tetraacyldisaccharide 4'-kinase